MNQRKLRSVSVLVVVCLLAIPAGIESKCNVTNTSVTTFAGPPDLVIVTKFLAASYQCALTQINADFCNPAATTTVDYLVASAYTDTMSPVCGWNCACGQVTIDGSDGLPVELMDFGIADLETGTPAPAAAEAP